MVIGYEMRSSHVDEAVAMDVKQWLLSYMKPSSRLGITSLEDACALPEFVWETLSLCCDILKTHCLCCVALARTGKENARIIYSKLIRSRA